MLTELLVDIVSGVEELMTLLSKVESVTEVLTELLVDVVSGVEELMKLLSKVESVTEVLVALFVVASDVGELVALLLAETDADCDELVEVLVAKVEVEARLEELTASRHCPSRPAGTASRPLPMAISSEPQSLALAK